VHGKGQQRRHCAWLALGAWRVQRLQPAGRRAAAAGASIRRRAGRGRRLPLIVTMVGILLSMTVGVHGPALRAFSRAS
jgi:hypothetical protein